MADFALVGAAGYIAPRHLKAIKDTGNELIAAYDKFDSVGRLDSSFPECSFFTEQELFDRHCSRLQQSDTPLQWLSVCTPNYTHDAFIRYGLRLGCDVICEKPVVLNPYNIDALEKVEQETGHKAYNILQLRLHDSIVALKKKVEEAKLVENFQTIIDALIKARPASLKGTYMKSAILTSTMGPGIRLNTTKISG